MSNENNVENENYRKRTVASEMKKSPLYGPYNRYYNLTLTLQMQRWFQQYIGIYILMYEKVFYHQGYVKAAKVVE